MINEDKFVISFTEFLPDSLGTLDQEAPYTSNYYRDNFDRGTMCCGCDK